MSTKKRLTIIAVAALLVSVSLLSGVTTATTPTTITIATSNTNPAVNQPFTLKGTLTANGARLSGRAITLNRVDPSGSLSAVKTTATATDGTYTFTRSESAQGLYYYQAVFSGDSTHASSNARVKFDVGTRQESVISIFATNYAPAVNHQYTLYGFLQDGVSGAPLAGQPINLIVRLPSGHDVSMGTTTDTNGAYKFTRSESAQGTYDFYVNFRGNSNYFARSSWLEVIVGNPIPTLLSLHITNTNPGVNQPFTISGYLTDIHGTKLSGRALTVLTRPPTGSWLSRETSTNSNGYYSVTFTEQAAGQYRYEVHFWSDGTYASGVNAVQVAVGILQPTSISLNTNVANPDIGESFTLSGKLTDVTGTPLSGKEIYLCWVVLGKVTPKNDFLSRYTDKNGYYFFVLKASSSGKYTYYARFYGDQTHAYSSASVTFTVHTLSPTTTTISASKTNPPVGQAVTITVTLKSGTTWLSAPIKIWHTLNGVRYEDGTHIVNGVYKYNQAFASKGQRIYHAEYAGNSQYGASSGTVTVNV